MRKYTMAPFPSAMLPPPSRPAIYPTTRAPLVEPVPRCVGMLLDMRELEARIANWMAEPGEVECTKPYGKNVPTQGKTGTDLVDNVTYAR